MHWLNSFSFKVSLPNSRLLQKYVWKGIKFSNWSYNQIIFTTSFAGQGGSRYRLQFGLMELE